MNIDCEHKTHGCQTNSFIWINDSKKIIYLEVPKNGSSYLKSKMRNHSWKNLERKKYIDDNVHYSDYFIFTIFRDMEKRILSNYKDFCLSNKNFRISQMSRLFNINQSKIKQLTFPEFLHYAIKHKDHHWNSQIKYMYLTLPNKPVIYDINDLDKLEKKLGFKTTCKVNRSTNKSINITADHRKLIQKLYKEDYENLDLIYNNILS